jgi:HlyD family secretion protein
VKFSKKWVGIAGVIVAIALFAAFGLNRKPATQYFVQTVQHGDISEVVEATGTINAVITVQVGSQVSGTINKIYADFNSKVKKGQVIAQIDPSLFQGALLQAKADMENAAANLAASRANLLKAQASAAQSKADYDRTAALTKAGVMSQQQLDLAQATSESADAQVKSLQAAIQQAQAELSQKRAAVTVAQTNLDHATITAPVDGVVINRSIDVGQTVAASLQAPTLFTIAQDLTKMQVYAKTDESDVGSIHAGQPVSFRVDAFPRDTFNGHVSQVRMNATTVQNVVTYDTIVDFDNPDLKLFPGMTAYVSIPVANATNVLKVPNGALRYKPDMPAADLKALMQKYGMDSGGGGQRGQGAAGTQTASGATGGGGTTPAGGAGGGRRFGAGGQQPGGGASAGQPRQAPLDIALVWKRLPDKTLEPVRIKTGITDHTVTEVKAVLKGDLKDGDELVVGSSSAAKASTPGGPGGVGGGPRPGGR